MPTGNGGPACIHPGAILEQLIEAGVEFILVGGLAAVVQGAPITTMDVDILHKKSHENIARLLGFLKSVDAVHRRPDGKVIAPNEEDVSGKGHVLLSTRLGPLDVLAVIEKGKSYEDLLAHSVEIEFRNHKMRVLDLEMLVQLKRKSRDPKDLLRLPVFEETLRQRNER